MPFATLKNLKMYYEIHGQGEPMILISGLKADHVTWAAVLNDLRQRYQVILFDNRAIGQSKDDDQAFTIETMADDVEALMRYLEIKAAHIVGHSMGGGVAQHFAYKYPQKVKTLFLCNTTIKLNEASRVAFAKVIQLYQQNKSQAEILAYLIPWIFSAEFMTPELRELMYEVSDLNPYAQSEKNYGRQFSALMAFDSMPWVQQINLPTVVIGSILDATVLLGEIKVLAGSVHAAKQEILPGGHASPLEQPKKLVEIICKYA